MPFAPSCEKTSRYPLPGRAPAPLAPTPSLDHTHPREVTHVGDPAPVVSSECRPAPAP